jgi:hypothetical protein
MRGVSGYKDTTHSTGIIKQDIRKWCIQLLPKNGVLQLQRLRRAVKGKM